MAEKMGKKRVEAARERELKVPLPVRPARKKDTMYFFWRRIGVIAFVLILAAVISGIAFVEVGKIREKRGIERRSFEYDKAINGTQIQAIRDTVEQMVALGEKPVPKDEVLSSSSNDYICTITTHRGIIALKKRGDLMREEVTRGGYNLSVIFLEDKMYMYHPQYNVWAMFPYDENMAISDDLYMNSAFSMSDLRLINESQALCVDAELPDDEFTLGDTNVVDAVQFLNSIKFLR
ncbi:hypothetical protein COV19_01895 [Candidatus Woesearchaeota archaeon CG10_big_fil_rev_8_21_14_0_10_44_13]|nr:MAG: hypothetical protein COV19_01895 [Candidatus Woesearchaeota archaeon CG10_big_fil_rev_8_21_14_0_10_44_13]